jgi:chaperonin cofactor prefoldin
MSQIERITYSKSAYISTTNEMLDLMESILSVSMTGDKMLLVDTDNIDEWLEEYYENCSIRVDLVTDKDEKLAQYLKELVEKLDSETGDIIFAN